MKKKICIFMAAAMLSSSLFIYSHHKQQLIMKNNIEATTKGVYDVLLKYGVEIVVGVSCGVAASYIYALLSSGEYDPSQLKTKWVDDTFYDYMGYLHNGKECQYSVDQNDNCEAGTKKDGNCYYDNYGYPWV